MENASKALLISGGVLLVIMILSFATYMWSTIGSQTARFYEDLDQSKIDEFNQAFLKYDLKKNEVTGANIIRKPLNIQEVVSAIFMAKNNNERMTMPVNVEVCIKGIKYETKEENEINGLLNSLADKQFYCDGDVKYNEHGLVRYINFNYL